MFDSIYESYKRELRTSLVRSIKIGKSQPKNRESFDAFIPLWALINGLQDSSNVPNPTKLMLMSHLRERNDLQKFLAVARDYHIEKNFASELHGAHQAMIFTSYFEELLSDSLLFINSFHTNNYRGCVVALRCMLEDLYRHLYYKDNRENFIRVHELNESEYDLNLTPAAFRNYLDKASYLKAVHLLKWNYQISGKAFSGIKGLNGGLYGKTSSYVHGSSPRTHNGFTSNLDFVYDNAKADEVLKVASLINELSVVYLCCGHIDQFSRLNEASKRIVLSTFKGDKRSDFRNTIRV